VATLFRQHPSKKRRPLWQYDAQSLLWRIKPDNAGHILGEARDPVERTTSFFCLREDNGLPLWSGKKLDDDWWVGIEDAADGLVFFHGYGKADMPMHLGIVACNILTGEEQWREPGLSFLLYYRHAVYAAAQRFDALVFNKLDAASGERLDDYGDDASEIHRIRATVNDEAFAEGYAWPEPFSESHAQRPEWIQRCGGLINADRLRGNLDVLDRGKVFFLAWHESTQHGDLAQYFAACDENGDAFFHDTILDHATAPGMDSFFVKDTVLFYVRNRAILTAHELTELLP
jgi:hypothetical protein